MKMSIEFESIEAYGEFIEHIRRTDPAKAKITRPMPQLTEEQIKIARDWEERSQKLPKPYIGGGYDARKSYEQDNASRFKLNETPLEEQQRRFKTQAHLIHCGAGLVPIDAVVLRDSDPGSHYAVLKNLDV